MVFTNWDVRPLTGYIRSLQDFKEHKIIDGSYDHIGATLADVVLQANNNYERNVRLRVERVRQLYSEKASLKALR